MYKLLTGRTHKTRSICCRLCLVQHIFQELSQHNGQLSTGQQPAFNPSGVFSSLPAKDARRGFLQSVHAASSAWPAAAAPRATKSQPPKLHHLLVLKINSKIISPTNFTDVFIVCFVFFQNQSWLQSYWNNSIESHLGKGIYKWRHICKKMHSNSKFLFHSHKNIFVW